MIKGGSTISGADDESSRHKYFICGPDPMMDAVEQALTHLGVSLANIHGERYNFV